MLHPEFDLQAIQSTTHPAAPLVVVHGPICRQLGINGMAGVLGPGFAANATIGRAIRLILMNVGGAYPGEADLATHGSPAKFSYCMTENIDESPWAAFHTTRGFHSEQNAVTVFAGEAPHNVNDHESKSAVRLLNLVADVMSALGHNNWYLAQHGRNDFVVILSPEHSALATRDGFTREDVQSYLFERARRSVRDLSTGGMWYTKDWPAWMNAAIERPETLLPVVRDARDILVLVAGGAGKHSLVIPGYGGSRSVTVPID